MVLRTPLIPMESPPLTNTMCLCDLLHHRTIMVFACVLDWFRSQNFFFSFSIFIPLRLWSQKDQYSSTHTHTPKHVLGHCTLAVWIYGSSVPQSDTFLINQLFYCSYFRRNKSLQLMNSHMCLIMGFLWAQMKRTEEKFWAGLNHCVPAEPCYPPVLLKLGGLCFGLLLLLLLLS